MNLELEAVKETLRAFGFIHAVETLDAHLEEASRSDISYLDFLYRLIEDEKSCRFERVVPAKEKIGFEVDSVISLPQVSKAKAYAHITSLTEFRLEAQKKMN